jgi:cell division protein FtsB
MMFMDRDNDGVGDAEDAFPDNPMGWRDLDGDGHPDLEGVPTDLAEQLASISASAAAASSGIATLSQRTDALEAAVAQLRASMLAEIAGMNASLAAKVQAEQTALMDRMEEVIADLDATDARVAAMNRTLEDLRKLDAIISDLGRLSGEVNATREKVDDLASGGGSSMVALQTGLLVVFIVLVLVSIVMGMRRRAEPPQSASIQPASPQPASTQPQPPQPPPA